MSEQIQNKTAFVFITIVTLVTIGAQAVVQKGLSASPEPYADDRLSNLRAAEEKLSLLCPKIKTIKRLSQMRELISLVKLIIADNNINDLRDQIRKSPITLVGSVVSPRFSNTRLKFFLNQNPITPCLTQADSIVDLEKVIEEENNVCSKEHLDIIEEYYNKHLAFFAHSSASASDNILSTVVISSYSGLTEKPLISKFFGLYANQVAFGCKSNLLHSLNIVKKRKIISQEDFERPVPWLFDDRSDICEKVKKFQEGVLIVSPAVAKTSSLPPPPPVSSEEMKLCNARIALAELSNIDELVEVLESKEPLIKAINELHNQYQQVNQPKQKNAKNSEHSDLFLIIPDGQKTIVNEILVSCLKVKPIYEQTIMPIARFARLGFNPAHPNFDKVCATNDYIKRWFGLTIVCDSMLSSHLPETLDKYMELIDKNKMSGQSFVVVDETDGKESLEKQMRVESEGPLGMKLLIQNQIDDELWIHKYGTSKLQRFRHGLTKKVLKLFKVEEIDDHLKFRENVQHCGRWFVRAIIVMLALITFNKVPTFI